MKSRIFASLITLQFLFASVFISISSAAVSSGQNCGKVKSIVKVGKKTYECGKNPFFKPKRNTWMLKECIESIALWKSARDEYENWKDLAKLAGAEGEKTIAELQVLIGELETTMKSKVCKRGV